MGKEVSLQKNEQSGSAVVTVPAQFVRLKDWSDKENLEWVEVDGNLQLQEAEE